MTSTDIKTIELIVNSEQAKKRLDELNQRLTTMKQKREESLSKNEELAIRFGSFALYRTSRLFARS